MRIKYYHGARRRGPYFEGWYLKHQSRDGEALAVIPALHIDRAGRRSASLQIITGGRSWWLEYPDAAFHASERRFQVQMDQALFTDRSMRLNVDRDGISLHGVLQYGPFSPLKSDIMGPFQLFGGMECAHGVLSMGHSLEGALALNGKIMDFSGGTGYIETDRGRSFPSAYLWTQCAWKTPEDVSFMLAIAAIPLPAGRFTGCICAIRCQGREYRLATYRGARIETWSGAGAVIRQGKYRLTVELLEARGHPLHAPVEGAMGRTIHESLCASLRCRFWSAKTLLFEHTDHHASFEYSSS